MKLLTLPVEAQPEEVARISLVEAVTRNSPRTEYEEVAKEVYAELERIFAGEQTVYVRHQGKIVPAERTGLLSTRDQSSGSLVVEIPGQNNPVRIDPCHIMVHDIFEE